MKTYALFAKIRKLFLEYMDGTATPAPIESGSFEISVDSNMNRRKAEAKEQTVTSRNEQPVDLAVLLIMSTSMESNTGIVWPDS